VGEDLGEKVISGKHFVKGVETPHRGKKGLDKKVAPRRQELSPPTRGVKIKIEIDGG